MMKSNFVIGLLLCNVFVIAYTASCGAGQCSDSQACCNDSANGPLCYDPNAADCVGGTKLCGKGEGACGNACYDTTTYTCTPDGHLLQGGTSPSLFCGAFSLTPCMQGQQCCNGQCYSPEVHVCLNNVLCPAGHSVCGYSSQCYDASVQECCNNQLHPKGTSACSDPSASCCSCACNGYANFPTNGYTIAGSAQCSEQHITSTFGALTCPGTAGGCGEDCVVSCGDKPFIFNYCFSNAQYGCSGHYLCSGGPFSCSTSSSGACPTLVAETGYSTTRTYEGATSYEVVPADYEGEVCCWCTGGGNTAISTPVPRISDCTAAYVAVNNSYSYPDTECRVWSKFTPFTDDAPHIACGSPQ